MERLKEMALQFNIELSDKQIEQFQIYYELFVETNKVMNLTAITELDEVITKHFLDSLALAQVYPEICDDSKNITVLDLGTGAGFPGIPLKIAFPHLQITLMDSLNKRIKFLQSVIDELGLCGIEAVHGRAEEAARNKSYRENFDLCVSRAVANLSTLSEYCIPFVKVGGEFISYKAADIEEEVNNAKKAIQVLGGKLTSVKKLTLPNSDIERSFVMIQKEKTTPKSYPRKAGTASKEPIQ
ncbi:MAG: 16S rRNA (guanine(527)-N(7))-methyltransferase RsmG [Lachnospiraceae bacterium]